MKILLVSDEEDRWLWDFFRPEALEGVELILACGDLKPEYLSFLVTMANLPLFYVRGNHDGCYDARPPEGCRCIEDQVVRFRGLRIAGLGGCLRYNGGPPGQYSEREMARRVRRLRWKLWRTGGVDIVITHAPPRGCGDLEGRVHRGFEAFWPLLELGPRLWAHGHVHLSYAAGAGRAIQVGKTAVVNACGKYIVEV